MKRVAAQVRPASSSSAGLDPDSLQLRLLYVVGELPTSGVHKRALAAALEERAALYRDTCAWRILAKHRLRIVGPTFSGSALSLRLTLLARLRQADTVEIVSGSATDLSNLRTLSSTAGPVLRFSATVHPNEDMNEALKRRALGAARYRATRGCAAAGVLHPVRQLGSGGAQLFRRAVPDEHLQPARGLPQGAGRAGPAEQYADPQPAYTTRVPSCRGL